MTIYVELLDEGTPCWRPVEATELRGGLFQITQVKPPDEKWEFNSGDIVKCMKFQNGVGMVAYQKVIEET